MAAWHDDKPGVGTNFYVGLAFAAYLGAMLGLVLLVLWKMRHLIAGLL